MNYAAVKYCDIANGLGCRSVLFVSGCRNHCKGCFQPETWDFSYGKPFDDALQEELLDSLKPDYIKGLTLLGGDPFEEENQKEILPFLRKVKELYPNKDVWAYTGYVFTDELIKLIDILVDGPFIEEQKDLTIKFRGSRNQRIIDIKKTLDRGEVVLAME